MTLHVVGAGVAGLAAAWTAARQGAEVVVHEATPQAGGRCRTVVQPDGFTHDNGTHVLLAANRNALSLIEAVGARDRWIEPEPDGLPVYDLDTGELRQVGLSPWSWLKANRRPPGLALADLPRLARLASPFGRDRSIADVIGDGPVLRGFVEPLTVAVLNTPVQMASSRVMGAALRKIARPGAARLLIAREGLGPGLVDPTLEALAGMGVRVAHRARLTAVETNGARAVTLVFDDTRVPLGPDDRVVLAVPAWEVSQLLPGQPAPNQFEPIFNVHYRWHGTDRMRFLGLVGGLAQWALTRPGQVSVTISAAADVAREEAGVLIARVWREVAAGLKALGLEGVPTEPPPARVVRERRATIRQAAGGGVRTLKRPLENLTLAGDWVEGRLPATIEAAVTSGFEAGRLMAGGARGSKARAPARTGAGAPVKQAS